MRKYFLPVLATCFFAFLHLNSTAQLQYVLKRSNDIPVVKNGAQMQFPWVGGMDAAQLSSIDLNQDGTLDLFVFDRHGARMSTFLNDGTAGPESNLTFDHTFLPAFPTGMVNWVLLRDYNCDGKIDIFTNAYGTAARTYKNISNAQDGLAFELGDDFIQNSVEFDKDEVQIVPIYSAAPDLPAIEDHDGDGDLDIFAFNDLANRIHYHEGLGADQGDCENVHTYRRANNCWGFVRESAEDNSLFLGAGCEEGQVFDPSGLRHVGGSLASWDCNGDGRNEVIVGDVTFSNLQVLINQGTLDSVLDSVHSVQDDFPAQIGGTMPLEIYNHPSAFYLDVNNDGAKDMIGATNAAFNSEDDESLWLYLNNGTTDNPDFALEKTNFLQDQMLEVGRMARPVFFDYNSDGLQDLVVANKELHSSDGNGPSQLVLFENTGTATDPAFTLLDANFLSLSDFSLRNIYPAFGDVDGDGDVDLIIGDGLGNLHLFANDAAPGENANFTLSIAQLQDASGEAIDVGKWAAPQLFDVNDDGILDLLVGEENGNINYFENTGTTTSFSFELMEDTLGDVVSPGLLIIGGRSIPHMYEEDGVRKMLVGAETGVVLQVENIDGNLSSTFDIASTDYFELQDGLNSSPWRIDINNDGLMDQFTGINTGGVLFFKGAEEPISVQEIATAPTFQLWPNPTYNSVQLAFEQAAQRRVFVVDIAGKIVLDLHSTTQNEKLDLAFLPRGVYTVVAMEVQNRTVQRAKLVKL